MASSVASMAAINKGVTIVAQHILLQDGRRVEGNTQAAICGESNHIITAAVGSDAACLASPINALLANLSRLRASSGASVATTIIQLPSGFSPSTSLRVIFFSSFPTGTPSTVSTPRNYLHEHADSITTQALGSTGGGAYTALNQNKRFPCRRPHCLR